MIGTFSCHDGLHEVIVDGHFILTKGTYHEEPRISMPAYTYPHPPPGACETDVPPTAFHVTAVL